MPLRQGSVIQEEGRRNGDITSSDVESDVVHLLAHAKPSIKVGSRSLVG